MPAIDGASRWLDAMAPTAVTALSTKTQALAGGRENLIGVTSV
jgi:hypothetical protein